MLSFNSIIGMVNSPIGLGFFAGGMTMVYLTLMSINSYLPSILILSLTIGYLVYYLQRTCPIRATVLPLPVTEVAPVAPAVPIVPTVPVGPSTITVNPA
jgi:hypothetical protein